MTIMKSVTKIINIIFPCAEKVSMFSNSVIGTRKKNLKTRIQLK